MSPRELCRILNSTPMGEVVTERLLREQMVRAGHLIAAKDDPKRINSFAYSTWCVRTGATQQEKAIAEASASLPGYEGIKERARSRQLAMSQSGRNIGELPAVVNPDRKAAAATSLRAFCESYFPNTFTLAWSEDHLRVISKIERAVLEGGLFAMAMPRGSGKTTLCEIGCTWSMLFGHRDFVVLIGADEDHAAGLLDSIKSEMENNDLLAEDFPEVCHPIRCLEGIHQRASGQLYKGRQTHIGWTAKELVLPTIDGSRASGAIMVVTGITGSLRGMKHKRVDGTPARPSLVLIDDPQTDESARSPAQCTQREQIIAGAILGLAGPGKKIAGLMTLTVVRPDDLADRILDRKKHPAWQAERTKLIYDLPKNESLWNQYAKLRQDGLEAGRGLRDATAFYKKNQIKMDLGARVAWPQRFEPDEISAVQNAMNLKLKDEAVFFAEYQNDPIPTLVQDDEALTPAKVLERMAGHKRGEVPSDCSALTMFIDVQGAVLYWAVVGWTPDFSGYVVDYGTHPDQKAAYFTKRNIKRTLSAAYPRAGFEGALHEGLEALVEEKCGREWRRDDGGTIRMDRCLIDANWGQSTETVFLYARHSEYASIVTPSHGRYYGARTRPFGDYTRKEGDRIGLNWRVPGAGGKRAVRHVTWDTNYWKSFVASRFNTSMGDPGSLTLFRAHADTHRMFAEHMCSEYSVKTSGRGRVVDEWDTRPDRKEENDFWDCIVGAAVAASMSGCRLPGAGGPEVRTRKIIRLSDIRKRRVS